MTSLIEDLATVLSVYGNSKGYNIPFSYYKKLASVGLEENIKYYMELDNKLDDAEKAELAGINKTISDEVKGSIDEKGKKCKN